MSSLSLNPFDLLGDGGEEGRRRKPAAPKQAAPKAAPAPQAATKPAAAPTAKSAPQQPPPQKAATAKVAPSSNAAPAKKDDGAAKPKPQGGDAQKGKSDVAKKPQAPRQQQAVQPKDEGFPSGEKPSRPPRERGAGDRRDRPPPRGRQFDRRSGTGRPANENKRSGSGRNNWGRLGEENPEATETPVEGEKEEGEKPAEGEAVPEEPQPPKEPELKGLDEYYESLKAKAVKIVEPPKKRLPGEGVDESAWAGYVPLAKDEASDDIERVKQKKATKKETANGVDKIAIDFYLPPPQGIEERGRGGDRRGRGGKGPKGVRGDRDRRQGGERKGNVRKGTDFNPSDSDFPVLSGSGGAPPPAAAKPAAAAPAPVKA